jgi:hypothetical protein
MPDPAATTITNIILGGPVGGRYLRGKHPRWRQGRDDRLSKTMAEAEHEKDLLAKALRRYGSDEALELAAILDRCSPRRRLCARRGPRRGIVRTRLRRAAAQAGPGPCLSGGGPSC